MGYPDNDIQMIRKVVYFPAEDDTYDNKMIFFYISYYIISDDDAVSNLVCPVKYLYATIPDYDTTTIPDWYRNIDLGNILLDVDARL